VIQSLIQRQRIDQEIAAKDSDQCMLRPPQVTLDAVAKLAEGNGRSINNEIVIA
jgi:hypothetical protein